MKIIFKVLILGFAILLFGCSKKVESTDASNSTKAKEYGKVDEPFEIKGVKLNQSLIEIKEKFKDMPLQYGESGAKIISCDDSDEVSKCPKSSNLTIVNRKVTEAIFAFNGEDKLNDMTLNFDEKYYDEVKEALIKKYGEPKAQRTVLSNKLTGTESIDELLMWNYKHSEYLIIKNHEKDGSNYQPIGSLSIYSTSGLDSKPAPADI